MTLQAGVEIKIKIFGEKIFFLKNFFEIFYSLLICSFFRVKM